MKKFQNNYGVHLFFFYVKCHFAEWLCLQSQLWRPSTRFSLLRCVVILLLIIHLHLALSLPLALVLFRHKNIEHGDKTEGEIQWKGDQVKRDVERRRKERYECLKRWTSRDMMERDLFLSTQESNSDEWHWLWRDTSAVDSTCWEWEWKSCSWS
jgi:hypothetical protein